MFKCIRYSSFRRVPIKFLYNSEFECPVKPLVTNIVVITRVLCNITSLDHPVTFLNYREMTSSCLPFVKALTIERIVFTKEELRLSDVVNTNMIRFDASECSNHTLIFVSLLHSNGETNRIL